MVEVAFQEKRLGNHPVLVRRARIAGWQGAERMLPGTWYRIQVSASRKSRMLRLRVSKWDGNRELVVVDLQNGHYSPSVIVPARIRNIWLGAPGYLDDRLAQRDEHFTGWMDRVVVASDQLDDVEQLVARDRSSQLKASLGPSKRLKRSDDPEDELSGSGPIFYKLLLEIALDPGRFLVCMLLPGTVYLAGSSRKARKVIIVLAIIAILGLFIKALSRRGHRDVELEASVQMAAGNPWDFLPPIHEKPKRLPSNADLLNESPRFKAAAMIANHAGVGTSATRRSTSPILFTILMPCFKQSQYVNEAIDSLARQSYTNWNLVFVDDASPDRCGHHALSTLRARFHWPLSRESLDTGRLPSQLMVREMNVTIDTFAHVSNGRTIRLLHLPHNVGLSTARNLAIHLSTTPWLVPLDADDALHPDYLASAANTIIAEPNANLLFPASQRFFGASEWTWRVPGWSPRSTLAQGPFPVSTAFKKEDWARVGGFNPLLPWGNEDWSFWISLSWLPAAKAQKMRGIGSVDESLSLYRFKSESMARNKEKHGEECESAMMTLHPAVFGADKVLRAHEVLVRASVEFREAVESNMRKIGTERNLGHGGEAALWLGLWWEGQAAIEREMKARIDSLKTALTWYVQGLEHTALLESGEENENRPAWFPRMAEGLPRDWQLRWRAGSVAAEIMVLERNSIVFEVIVSGKKLTAGQLCAHAIEMGGLELEPHAAACGVQPKANV